MAKQHQKPAERPADHHVAVEHLPLISLSHSPTNPRKTYPERELNELAQSIRDNGIINPITVRPIFEETPSNRSLPVGIIGYEVVAGNRRFRAAQIAESETVPCIVRDLTDEQVMDIQIAENLHRQDVPPLEEAAAFQAMLDSRKMDVDMLAGKIGKSARYVYRRLKLNNLHDDYRPYLESGELQATTAEVLSSYPMEAQKAIFKNTHYKDGAGNPVFDTGKRIKDSLERETCHKLNKAIFDTAQDNMQPGLVACTRCPKNTAVATLLFPDGEANPQCTDKACWKLKEAVHIALRVQEYEAWCKKQNIEPVYCDLYYLGSEETKRLEKLLGHEPKIMSSYSYQVCEPDEDGARQVLFVGGLSWGDEPNNSYKMGWAKLERKQGNGGGDYEIRKIQEDDSLTEDEKKQAIEQLLTTRKQREFEQAEHRRVKRWKERLATHVLSSVAITGPTPALLKIWVKRLEENDINSWWKYVFQKKLLVGWRPESFPVNQDILEGENVWNDAMESTWKNILNTADGERDRAVWMHWLDDEEKQAFISNIADTASAEDLAGIQARIMMIEVYQSEKSWNGTDIEVQDYAPLLGDKSPADFEAEPEPERSEEIEDPDDDLDGDWDADEDE